MYKKVIFALLLLPLCLQAQGNPKPVYETYNKALGFFAGEIGGTGLSHLRPLPGGGIQFTVGALYRDPERENFWNDYTMDYNLGIQIHQRVYGEDFNRWLGGQLYFFQGIKHRGYIPVDYQWTEGNEETYRVGNYHPTLTVGAGIGLEMILFKHFSFPLEFGYHGTWDPQMGELPKQFEVDLAVQGGIRYRY